MNHVVLFFLQALQSLGYCPQFDAVPQEMTGSEALRLFAALRGIPEECIETIIDDLSTKLFLRGNINKMIKEMRYVLIHQPLKSIHR